MSLVEIDRTDKCEQEAIHAPGVIQPHCALVCVDPSSLVVQAISANFAVLIGRALAVGAPLAACVPEPVLVAIHQGLADGSIGQNHLSMFVDPNWLPPFGAQIQAHLHLGTLFCEFEPLQEEDFVEYGAGNYVQQVIAAMRDAPTMEGLSNIVADGIRRLSGMERILVYRFDGEGHGEVIGQSLVADWEESFLGLHFPADDIPSQARALYLIAPARFTPDRDYVPIALEPATNSGSGRPFDLSRCHCRSLSPIHRMYQSNLGVNGALSVSVLERGRLWGLIVGHHRAHRRVPIPARPLINVLTDALSMRLDATETEEEKNARAHHVFLHARLLEQIAGADDFVSPLVDGPVKLTDIFFASSGAAVVFDEGQGLPKDVRTVGLAPPAEAIVRLADHCRDNLVEGVYATDCISLHLPDFDAYKEIASGVLVITVGDSSQHMIFWFRPEHILTKNWAGATPDAVARAKQSGNYFPRESFSRWVTNRRGHSRPWPQWKIEIARSLRTALNDVVLRQMRTIRELNSLLTKNSEAKSRFLSNMSHELRTPLNAVLGFAEVLLAEYDAPLTDKQRGYVNHILAGGSHLLNLINEVLDLSKVEAGDMTLTMTVVQLRTVIEECLSLVSPIFTKYEVKAVDETAGCDTTVRADPQRTKQLILNLLSNAAKYNRPGGKVIITCETIDDGFHRLTIADTGKGIPDHKKDRLFEAFSRLGAEATEIEGTGIGLALTKSIIEAMGGRIGFFSVVDEGSRFWLDFPLSNEKAENPAIADENDPPLHYCVEDRLVLYIEDDAANRHLVEALFEQLSPMRLITATSVEKGLVLARSRQPDVILLDINFPGTSGFEAIALIKGDVSIRDIPVVALSADATGETIERALAGGFVDYLTKPVRLPVLVRTISRLMGAQYAGHD